MNAEAWRRIEEILDAALTSGRADWDRVLDERCGHDTALRAEVEALLAQVDSAQEFLQSPPGAVAAAIVSEAEGRAREQGIEGRRLGAYTIERPLGRGGMGSVWLASRSDGRYEGRVAVKLLSIAQLDPFGSERFRREGTTLARLTHPNIARLLDAGVTDDGQPYLVLEHVEGRRIDTYCEEERLTPEQRLALFLQVLDAVGHAHANLIVHRDLKPSNILVTADGTVKLLDFGIAKLLEAESEAGTATLTDLAGGALTPEYAAPEQVTGTPITTATDVYALGVLLYILLARRHPTGQDLRTRAEHLRAVIDVEPVHLSAATTDARLKRHYPGDLDNIVAKALKKRPDERYASVTAFADDLRRYLNHEPVAARPDSLGYRTAKFLRRHRGPVAVATLVVVALVAATGVAWRARTIATRQRDEAVYYARRAEAIRDFQTALISQIGVTRVSLRELLDKGVASLARRPVPDPRLHATLLLQFADRYGELEIRDVERALLARADSAAEQARDPSLRATLGCSLARHFVETGNTDSARVVLAGRRATAEEGADADARAGCLLIAALLLQADKQHDSASVFGRWTLALLDSAGRHGTLEYYVAQTELADILRAQGRVREAIALDDSCRVGLAALGLDGSLLAAGVNNNLAQVLLERGERARGIAILRDVLEETRRADSTGEAHPIVAFNYGSQLMAAGQLDSALYWYSTVARNAQSGQNLDVERRALIGVARVSSKVGDIPRARAAFQRVLVLGRRLNRPTARDSLYIAASIALAARDTAGAVRLFDAVLREDGYYSQPTPRSRAPLLELARIRLARGEPAQGLEYARVLHRLGLTDSIAQFQSADVGEADLLAARAFAALGSADSAAWYARAAVAALTVGAGATNPLTLQAEALADSLARRPTLAGPARKGE
jgi:tetratricopeptide (TPR) repeat protein